ncbi:MAG: hypothetical protein GX034_02840 [Clostridiaceae bacterium]|jgi:hypothetical protein|nr:hypothetical protein [Clostridiaceae bacterium]
MREIGSKFYLSSAEMESLSDYHVKSPGLKRDIGDIHYLSSGRQAIRFCLIDMQQDPDIDQEHRVALLPEFTCNSVIHAFLLENYQIHFYPLKKNLQTSCSEINLLSQAHKASVVMLHPYFGFETLQMDEALRSDVKYIFDDTQSFCSKIEYPQVDYLMASIRKWGPFPDGAICLKLKGKFFPQEILPQDKKMLDLMQKAYQLKAEYIDLGQGSKDEFSQLYKQAYFLLESEMQVHEMSDLAQKLYFSYDFDSMKQQRRENYLNLLSFPAWPKIGQVIFPDLPENNTPLYFPFYVQAGKRDELQSYLIREKIYAPVIWPVPALHNLHTLSRQTRYIYEQILVLPIDQRYKAEDMSRIKEALEGYISTL